MRFECKKLVDIGNGTMQQHSIIDTGDMNMDPSPTCPNCGDVMEITDAYTPRTEIESGSEEKVSG